MGALAHAIIVATHSFNHSSADLPPVEHPHRGQYDTVGKLASLLTGGDPHESPKIPAQLRNFGRGSAWSGERRRLTLRSGAASDSWTKSQTGGETYGKS
jgi:hypothetical protein